MTAEVMQEFFAEVDLDDDCCLVVDEFTHALVELDGLVVEAVRECPTTTRGWEIRAVYDMVDEDGTDCIEYPEAEWYYECAKEEHSWTTPLEDGYRENNFDQGYPECLNYNEFEWMIKKFGGLKDAPACKVIPADKSPIELECPEISLDR